MHDASLSRAAWARRALAFAGLVFMGAGLLMLGAAPRSAAATQARAHAALASGNCSVTAAGATTCTGPKMWDPTHKRPFANASTVTVSQASSLVNQLVQVSWTNFTPSVPNNSPGPYYSNTATYYAAMVTECQGTAPATMDNCYLADNHGLPLAFGTAGIPNTQYAITTAKGTGQASIDIETNLENSFLGCDQNHPCSLVVVPGQGGAPGNCTDHNGDIGLFGSGNALASNTFSLTTGASGACAWSNRIVIPLSFAPTPSGCPQRNPAFTVAGSPMMAGAMQQWLTGLCAGAHGMTINYDSTLGEPTAVTNAVSKTDNVALTTLPASADGVATGNTRFVYAPIAVSAVSVAYWIDNTSTGEQLGGLELNQRLLAKLLTTSYNPAVACQGIPPPANCDPGVDHNPFNIFYDPEFRALNPAIAAAVPTRPLFSGQANVVPTVLSDPTDMTWTVSRWIGADPGASSFLAGTFDPYGMHVNTNYLGLKYPVNTFQVQDPNLLWSNEYQPVFGLGKVVNYQAVNQDSGANVPFTNPNGTITYTKDPPQPVGHRALIAILDQGNAALDHFPTAKIRNAAGDYVRPTNGTMAAALSHMSSDGNGTLQMNLTNTDPRAYPLTMVIYAMVPTSGLSHAKAAAIARFLDFAVGPGQTTGIRPGQLPAGYLPLPNSLRARTRKLAVEVANQTGGNGGGNGGGGGGGSPSAGPTSSSPPSSASTPGPGASPSVSLPGAQAGPGISLAAAHPQPAALGRFALPALLILGGLSALAGSSALLGTAEGGLRGRLRAFGAGTAALGRSAWTRVRPNRTAAK
jgi:ABC-type phosphate transport system substrate-binding protein